MLCEQCDRTAGGLISEMYTLDLIQLSFLKLLPLIHVPDLMAQYDLGFFHPCTQEEHK
jgi:hypothetical protein